MLYVVVLLNIVIVRLILVLIWMKQNILILLMDTSATFQTINYMLHILKFLIGRKNQIIFQ